LTFCAISPSLCCQTWGIGIDWYATKLYTVSSYTLSFDMNTKNVTFERVSGPDLVDTWDTRISCSNINNKYSYMLSRNINDMAVLVTIDLATMKRVSEIPVKPPLPMDLVRALTFENNYLNIAGLMVLVQNKSNTNSFMYSIDGNTGESYKMMEFGYENFEQTGIIVPSGILVNKTTEMTSGLFYFATSAPSPYRGADLYVMSMGKYTSNSYYYCMINIVDQLYDLKYDYSQDLLYGLAFIVNSGPNGLGSYFVRIDLDGGGKVLAKVPYVSDFYDVDVRTTYDQQNHLYYVLYGEKKQPYAYVFNTVTNEVQVFTYVMDQTKQIVNFQCN